MMVRMDCETVAGSRGGRQGEEVGLRVSTQTLRSSRDSEIEGLGMFQRRNCTWKTMAESRLPRLQPRMMATSRMETLVVREEEDVESAREE